LKFDNAILAVRYFGQLSLNLEIVGMPANHVVNLKSHTVHLMQGLLKKFVTLIIIFGNLLNEWAGNFHTIVEFYKLQNSYSNLMVFSFSVIPKSGGDAKKD
jgi:hypothetical protein